MSSGRLLQFFTVLLLLGLAPGFDGQRFTYRTVDEFRVLDPWRVLPANDLPAARIQPIGIDFIGGSELFDPWSSDPAPTTETVPTEVLINPWASRSSHR